MCGQFQQNLHQVLCIHCCVFQYLYMLSVYFITSIAFCGFFAYLPGRHPCMKGDCKLGKRQGWLIMLLCIKAAEEMFCHM